MDDSGHRENGWHKASQVVDASAIDEADNGHYGRKGCCDPGMKSRHFRKKGCYGREGHSYYAEGYGIAERNNAIMERDNAIDTLQYQENAINNGNISPYPSGCQIPRGVKYMHHPQHQHVHHQSHMVGSPYTSHEMQITNTFSISPVAPEHAKPRRTKRAKDAKHATPTRKALKPMKKVKREGEDLNKSMLVKSQEWKNGPDMGGGSDDVNRQLGGGEPNWKDQDLGLNQVAFDESTMPVPVCSCTGVLRPCYKWGNGGWQSSCCTTNLSIYPLPAVPNKRHARIGGRKMSGSAFNKLLGRLAAKGHDLSNLVDLKEHWAKHGTNRYITIK